MAAVDLSSNADCLRDATRLKYKIRDDWVFMRGKGCLGARGDTAVSGLGYDLGFLASPGWREQPTIIVTRWRREHALDLRAAGPFPAPHANHVALVRAWLAHRRFSTAALDRLFAAGGGDAAAAAAVLPPWQQRPPRQRQRGTGGGRAAVHAAAACANSSAAAAGGGRDFAVVHWRTETLSDGAFARCSRLVTTAVHALTHVPPESSHDCTGPHNNRDSTSHSSSLRVNSNSNSSKRALPHHQQQEPLSPLVLVTDLSSSLNPCGTSFNYGVEAAAQRSQSPLLRMAGVVKYDTDLLDAGVPPMDAGVISLHEYLIALAASDYHSCNVRGASSAHQRRHKECHACFWPSEFIARISHTRKAAGLPVHGTFLDSTGGPRALS
jgi:hypothetical protein